MKTGKPDQSGRSVKTKPAQSDRSVKTKTPDQFDRSVKTKPAQFDPNDVRPSAELMPMNHFLIVLKLVETNVFAVTMLQT
jgi:hypothetical protein